MVALGLALFDNFADAAGCPDSAPGAAICHACSCGPHLASPAVAEVIVAPAPVPYASYKPLPYAFLLQKSLLRPPCLAA